MEKVYPSSAVADTSRLKLMMRSGLACTLWLNGTTVVLFFMASFISALLENLSVGFVPHEPSPLLLLLLAMLIYAIGGAGWGRRLAHIAGAAGSWRYSLAGAISYGLVGPAVILILGQLENSLVSGGGSSLPVHNLYTLLFVIATLLVSAVMGFSFGIASGRGRLAVMMAFGAGVSSALAFLAVNIILDLLGRRVGGPNAAETATMITTTLGGNVVAAFAGGGISGLILSGRAGAMSLR